MKITRKVFDRLVEEAIATLPAEFVQWIDEVPIIVEDHPGKSDANALPRDDDEISDAPLGLYVGNDLHEGRQSGGLPPRVMIYREPLMNACTTQEQLAEEIRKTLLHELGHYAGMDEDQLEDLGYGSLEQESIDWDVEDEEQ